MSGLATSMTTLLVGWSSRTTVNESVPPASVTDADVFDTVPPAEAPPLPARLPDEASFQTNTSTEPFVVRLAVPSPGSKSTVERNCGPRGLSFGANRLTRVGASSS